MKKALIAILALAVLAAGVIFAVGQTASKGDKRWGRRGGHHRVAGIAFRAIGLTEDQKAKLKEFRAASRTNNKPVREAMKANRQKMRTLTANGAFDEAQVTTLANEQAGLQAKLIVERQRMKSQFFAILTEEQKAKLAEMKAKVGERRKERRAAKAEKVSD
jgi:periplasmic protein CpxP/Spy